MTKYSKVKLKMTNKKSLTLQNFDEHSEQTLFVSWFKYCFPEVLIFAIPNGGVRHIGEAKKLKAEGVTSGVPDLYIPEWKLWIEMKKAGGRLSASQKNIKHYLEAKCHDRFILGVGRMDAAKQVLTFRGEPERLLKYLA